MSSKNLDGKLVKTAHSRIRYSDQDVEDLLACTDPVTGPQYFLKNFFYIQHPVEGKMTYAAFDYQEGLLESYHTHRFSVNMLGRQMGKTTTAVGYLLWYAMFVPDSTILIAAHKFAGAQEIMSRLRYAYELCPDHIRCGVTSYNKQSIEFDNGSRLMAQTTTETTGRGMSVSLLYCDEFAYVEPNIATEFWTSIAPTLSTGGKAIITSTPNSDEDQFALIWKEANKRLDDYGNTTELGKNGFYPYLAIWNQHPDRDQKWADEMRSQLGEERFRRENECEFIIFDETLISSVCLATLEGKDPLIKMGQVRWYKKIDARCTYIVALDPSLGTGGNYSGLQVIELPSLKQVGEWQHNTTPIQMQVKIMREICRFIETECLAQGSSPSLYYSVENNTIGEAALVAINELDEATFPGMFLSEPTKKGHVRRFRRGFNTTHSAKINSCAKLKHLIEKNKMEINSKSLISELKTYVANGITFKAKEQQNDDLVSAMLLAIRMIMMLSDWDTSVYEKMVEEERMEEYDLPMPIYMSSF
jgi:hypothetical protein